MATVQLFVGANNFTGQVDRDLLIETLNDRHEGYTLAEGQGMWQGKPEPMVMVTISDESFEKIMETALKVKMTLNQDAVGWINLPDMHFA